MNTKTRNQDVATTGEPKPRLRNHVLAIGVLSVVMFVLLDSATDEEVLDISSLLQMQEQQYDYFMTGVDSTHYKSDGLADYRFRASRITHFPNPQYSLVVTPELLIIQEDSARWTINSETGVVDQDDENRQRLVLNDNVIINGVTNDGRPVNIYTDTLTIYPDEKHMRSDSDVLFESDGFSSTSRGFFADMNTNEIRQLANGQLRYEN